MKLKFYPKPTFDCVPLIDHEEVEASLDNVMKEDKDMYFKELMITVAGVISLFFITHTLIQQQNEIDSLKQTIKVQSKLHMESLMK
jgi:hypothetical protein